VAEVKTVFAVPLAWYKPKKVLALINAHEVHLKNQFYFLLSGFLKKEEIVVLVKKDPADDDDRDDYSDYSDDESEAEDEEPEKKVTYAGLPSLLPSIFANSSARAGTSTTGTCPRARIVGRSPPRSSSRPSSSSAAPSSSAGACPSSPCSSPS
jgi:hypothetical protein